MGYMEKKVFRMINYSLLPCCCYVLQLFRASSMISLHGVESIYKLHHSRGSVNYWAWHVKEHTPELHTAQELVGRYVHVIITKEISSVIIELY